MKALCARVLLVGCLLTNASCAVEGDLPAWARGQWAGVSKQANCTVSTRLDPAFLRGDFDGDEGEDLAILAQCNGKEGIAFLWRNGGAPVLLGAGTPFGNGGDDFIWVDFWYIEFLGRLRRGADDSPIRLKHNGLLVAKEGSGGGLIYFENGEAKWLQQGD